MTPREIDARIAEKVLGQVPCNGWEPVGAPLYGMLKKCDHAPHSCYPPDFAPEYSTNASASKQVRDKLAERFDYWRLTRHRTGTFTFMISGQNEREKFVAEASTEERAVAICALKTVGITVEESK